MGRKGKLSAVVLITLGLASGGGYFASRARAEAGETAAAAAASVTQKKSSAGKQLEDAKIVYANNCARCHGSDGSGQTAMGRAFAAPNLNDAGWWKKERPTDRRLNASIRHGRNQQRMPAFGQQLSKSEVAALVRLVRTFNGK